MLQQRLWRFAKASLLAYRERGLGGGTRYILMTIRRKAALLLLHWASRREIAALRAGLAVSRVAASPGSVHIALAVSGGIGDLLVVARFMRDVAATAGPLRFDVFAKRPGITAWLFQNVDGFGCAYPDSLFHPVLADYDIAMRANTFVFTYSAQLQWSRICQNRRLAEVVFALLCNRAAFDEFVELHPYRDNELVRNIVRGGWTRRDYLHHLAGISYGGDRFDVPCAPDALAKFGLEGRRYVTVHNGFDTDFIVTGQTATKCYPHFGKVVALLRRARPDILFVQLGTVTSEVIAECDVNLIKLTSLRDAAALIAGAALHLDNEGGLVHLAACLGTRSVVVFGPTPADYFGYDANINLSPPVCGDCWWTTRSWMDKCAEGFAEPRCMTEQMPDTVAAHALDVLPRARPVADAGWVPVATVHRSNA
ncbi:glycosyltransferase family 9 protein [Acidocella sp.]|uniref:glycosyltransferase family 9 protein n=2 Tax=Acidocella sp. TaxID=50710 RepID=UPI00262AA974|nr:glycosyltransferase family 9 protein [Acidocella sp.]